jgi:hypothetical protein
MVQCELRLHPPLGQMIPLLVEYINALHSCLNTTTFFSLSLMGDGTKPGTTFVPRETLNVPTFVPKVGANYGTKV